LLKKIYKMQHLEGSRMPILYTGSTVLKVNCCSIHNAFTTAQKVNKFSDLLGQAIDPPRPTYCSGYV